jgi:hypothetical protein
MMGIFDNLEQTNDAKQQAEKVGGNYITKTGKYDGIVKMAYAVPSKSSDSIGIRVIVDTKDGEIQETVYISYQDGKTYKVNDKGEKIENFGFTKMKRLNFLLTGNNGIPNTEKKTIKVYDFDAGKDVPKEMDVITEWLNKPISVLAVAVKEFKQKNVNGTYVDTDEVKNRMDIKAYVDFETGQTATEKENGEDAEYLTKWLDKYTSDYVIDKTEGKEPKKTSNSTNTGSENSGGVFS